MPVLLVENKKQQEHLETGQEASGTQHIYNGDHKSHSNENNKKLLIHEYDDVLFIKDLTQLCICRLFQYHHTCATTSCGDA